MLEIPQRSVQSDRPLLFRVARYILIVVVVIASGFFLYPGSEAVELQTVTVETGDLEEVVTAQGKLEPRDFVNLGAQVSGQLKKLHFLPGDVVKVGDLIAEIDPQLFAAQVAGDKARLKTLEAQYKEQSALVAQARLVKERNEKLLVSRAVSQEIFEQSQTDLIVAGSRLEALSA